MRSNHRSSTKALTNSFALLVTCLVLSASSVAWGQIAPQILLDNPCSQGQVCEWEEIILQAPIAQNITPEAATKGFGDCPERNAPTCPRQTTQTTKVYIQKKDRTAFQNGRFTSLVSSSSSAQVTTTERVMLVPVAGQQLNANHYDDLRFGWFHRNGAPVNSDHKFRTGDAVGLVFVSNRDGHVYVVNVDSTGTQTQLYPSATRPSERSQVLAKSRVVVEAQFVGNPGIERVYAVFSASPISNVNELVAAVHRRFDGRPVDQMRMQAGTFNPAGEVSSNGILLSQAMQPVTKGMMALSSSVQTSGSSPTLETGAVIKIDPLITVQHPYSVMAIDLLHIAR